MSKEVKISHLDFLDKIGTEELYLLNDWEDMAVRIAPNNGGVFTKFKGKEEFKAQKGSKVVADAIIERSLMTKEEYEKY